LALKAGLFTMVLATIIGAILANLLLALGLTFFIGGTKYHTQDFNPVTARLYSMMMVIADISMGGFRVSLTECLECRISFANRAY
jgi:Ca2+:H+ antiporter